MDNYTNHTISSYVNNLSINSYDRQIITNCLVHLLEYSNIDDKKVFLKMLNHSSIDGDIKSEEFRNSMWKTHNILKTINVQESYDKRDESPDRESPDRESISNIILYNYTYIKIFVFMNLIYILYHVYHL